MFYVMLCSDSESEISANHAVVILRGLGVLQHPHHMLLIMVNKIIT